MPNDKMTMRAYPDGLDCVWLGVDRNGNLGAFVTAGAGSIPVSVLNDLSLPIEEIETAVCQLPRVSEVRLLFQIKRLDDFVEMAQRGFFVYDWTDIHRTAHESIHAYELMVVPPESNHDSCAAGVSQKVHNGDYFLRFVVC